MTANITRIPAQRGWPMLLLAILAWPFLIGCNDDPGGRGQAPEGDQVIAQDMARLAGRPIEYEPRVRSKWVNGWQVEAWTDGGSQIVSVSPPMGLRMMYKGHEKPKLEFISVRVTFRDWKTRAVVREATHRVEVKTVKPGVEWTAFMGAVLPDARYQKEWAFLPPGSYDATVSAELPDGTKIDSPPMALYCGFGAR